MVSHILEGRHVMLEILDTAGTEQFSESTARTSSPDS